MPAFVIFIRERTLDQSELQAYAQAAPPSLEGWPSSSWLPMVAKTCSKDEPEGVAIAEFPSLEEARRWYDSPAYQAALPKECAHSCTPVQPFTSTGKMVVESKADMKKRGLRSPDLADAFLLTFACGIRRKIERYRRPLRGHSAWAA